MHRKYVCNLWRADADLSHEQELKGIVANIFSSVKIFGRVVGQVLLSVLLNWFCLFMPDSDHATLCKMSTLTKQLLG